MKPEKPNGRPPQFKPEFSEQAHRLCLLGLTDAELGTFFDASERTINRWKKAHPAFEQALQSGKSIADGKVARSLYQRATGASHPDTSVNVVNGEVVVTELVKHYPPETAAAKFWLINRQPRLWKDRVELVEEVNVNVFPPKEVMDAIYAKALAAAAERDKFLIGRRERLGIVIENRDVE